MNLTSNKARVLAAQLNKRLAENTYEPTKAEAIAINNGITVGAIHDEAFHDVELCVDFASFHNLNIYASYNSFKGRVEIKLF